MQPTSPSGAVNVLHAVRLFARLACSRAQVWSNAETRTRLAHLDIAPVAGLGDGSARRTDTRGARKHARVGAWAHVRAGAREGRVAIGRARAARIVLAYY